MITQAEIEAGARALLEFESFYGDTAWRYAKAVLEAAAKARHRQSFPEPTESGPAH